MTGIYGIQNTITGAWYVGQAQDIAFRNATELRSLRSGKFHGKEKDNRHLINAWKKYGEAAFSWVVLEECTIEQLDEREIYWIAEKDSFKNGYNQTAGGGGMRGWNQSEAQKKRQSDLMRGRYAGKNNPNFGNKWTVSKKKRNAERSKSLWQDEEYRQKTIEAMTGKTLSEEHRRKLSEANKHRAISAETRKKLSAINKGKTLSKETRKKLSAAASNRSAETLQKMSESRKGKLTGKENPAARAIINADTGEIYATVSAAAKAIGKSPATICDNLKGRNKTAGGYHWKYLQEVQA